MMAINTAAKTINVATDFSRFPAGRTEADGPFSGETFRNTVLAPALSEFPRVVINLDGARGYGSSFLEEAFGGLVRAGTFTKERLLDSVTIVSEDDPSLVRVIPQYIRDAK